MPYIPQSQALANTAMISAPTLLPSQECHMKVNRTDDSLLSLASSTTECVSLFAPLQC